MRRNSCCLKYNKLQTPKYWIIIRPPTTPKDYFNKNNLSSKMISLQKKKPRGYDTHTKKNQLFCKFRNPNTVTNVFKNLD